MRAKVEGWKNEMVDNKAVTDWLDGLWEKARAGLLKSARDPDAAMAGRFGEALRQLGETLQTGPRLRARRSTSSPAAPRSGIVASYGDGIVKLGLRDGARLGRPTVTERLEGAVGRDLQYIRINGTLVGGLVGLVLHLIEVAT